MKAIVFTFTAVVLSFAAAVVAQDGKKTERVTGSGDVKSEKRDVEKFDAVTLRNSADVFITIGEKTEVTVTADENILPYITTEVKENTLTISTKPHVSLQHKELKVSITTPNLSAVKVASSGDIAVEGLKGDSFKIEVNGSGDVAAKGQVQKLDCLVKGSGDLALGDLEAKTVSIKLAGSGDAKLNATESLQAKISGSGDIAYKDNANLKVIKKVAGSGDIHKVK
jgi:hypothetical protein